MGKMEDKDRVAAEPGEQVKDWMEDEENKEFDDKVDTVKTMAEDDEKR
jgi:hypothetical protein